MRAAPLLLVLVVLVTACKPDLDERESSIESPRILAIVSEPPEARPGEAVQYTAVVATREGPELGAPIQWAYCATPKLLTENGSVSPECTREGVRPLAASGPRITAPTLPDACALFGPDVPPGGFRPRDADGTGGYYQPLRASWAGLTAFARQRVTCNLANAPADVTLEFRRRYMVNKNPRLGELSARVGGEPRALDHLPLGRDVEFTVAWPPEDAESYVSVDPATQSIVPRREAMRVSWYATAGTFATDRTGRTEAELDTFTNNVWSIETAAPRIHLWVVLRDSRGGSAYAVTTLSVNP
ncbi:hypothetical protein LZC95_10060 [Pendulispora brunnea]|uniref:Septum formation-related domain-containing protein n=1 Tax=Pendulispora brunnea TaxID=2905690 RepID=A0ABZ2KHY4_9BACT